jgi:transposase
MKTFSDCEIFNKAAFPESMRYPIHYGTNILASAIYCENYRFTLHDRYFKFLCHLMKIKIC